MMGEANGILIQLFDVEYEGQVPGQGVIDQEVIEEGS
jgi:hypothetical protein